MVPSRELRSVCWCKGKHVFCFYLHSSCFSFKSGKGTTFRTIIPDGKWFAKNEIRLPIHRVTLSHPVNKPRIPLFANHFPSGIVQIIHATSLIYSCLAKGISSNWWKVPTGLWHKLLKALA